ncbi:MAG: aromatic ring-hydroxylating oxygenase subunit alpha [Thiolinea sp.]
MSNSTTSSVLEQLNALANLPLDQATAMPPQMYQSAKINELEQAHIFDQQWLCAGRSDVIPNAGDYLSYDIGSQPVAIIRQEDGSIKAFANVCRHRMMTLLTGSGHCKRKRINCPYHAWSYGIDGQLLGAPHMQERPDFDKADFPLKPVRCEVWEGWIYVTLNAELEPVADLLAELHPLVANYRMADYVEISQQNHVWDTNWKMLTENFMEGYHLPVTHRATVGGHFPVKDTRFSELPPNPAFTYQYFTKNETAPVGNAHPDNTWLEGNERRTSLMPTIFPSHMYVLAPDHLWYLSLQPLGHDKVNIRYGIALAPEVLAASDDPEGMKAEVIAFLDQVNAEDKDVVEGIFRGSRASLSEPGPLCWLERENHEFTQYIARRLCINV